MFDAAVAASTSQSSVPPKPFVTVTVTGVFPATDVALTSSDGGGSIVKVTPSDRPPPGAGENTETAAVPVAATSEAEMAARQIRLYRGGTMNIAEQAPGSFKDIRAVIEVMNRLQIAQPVVRVRPLATLKG